jgi:hypothetical protein
MNDLNYTVDGVRYYYQLDTSKWYTLDNDNQVKYVNEIKHTGMIF